MYFSASLVNLCYEMWKKNYKAKYIKERENREGYEPKDITATFVIISLLYQVNGGNERNFGHFGQKSLFHFIE